MVRLRMMAAMSVAAMALIASVGAGVLDRVVDGIARDNLSNAGFDRDHTTTPAALGLPWQDITIRSDGLDLAAWWIPSSGGPNATTTVILVHGLSATMGKVLHRWGPNLHDAGYSLLAVDLRNHGASDDGPHGRVSYGAMEALDVLAAMAYVRDHAQELGVDPDGIVLYGASMGANTVMAAAATLPEGLQAVIFDSGFASLRYQARLDGAEDGYPLFLIDMVVDRMDALAPGSPSAVAPERLVARHDVPLLLAHCSNDTRVDASSHPRLAALAPAAVTWFKPCPVGLSDEHHVDGWMLEDYNRTILDFLARSS